MATKPASPTAKTCALLRPQRIKRLELTCNEAGVSVVLGDILRKLARQVSREPSVASRYARKGLFDFGEAVSIHTASLSHTMSHTSDQRNACSAPTRVRPLSAVRSSTPRGQCSPLCRQHAINSGAAAIIVEVTNPRLVVTAACAHLVTRVCMQRLEWRDAPPPASRCTI